MPRNTPSAVTGLGSPEAAGMALQAGDIAGVLARVHQVGGRDADVLGGPVLAADVLDRAAEGLEQGRRLLGAAVADDHGLAAAQLQVGHGVLVGHGPREPQRVVQRRLGVGIGPHAAAAGGGAAGRGMHGDDAFQAGFFVGEGVDAFVALEGGGIEQGHAADIADAWETELRPPLRPTGPRSQPRGRGAARRPLGRAPSGSAARRRAAARRDRG